MIDFRSGLCFTSFIQFACFWAVYGAMGYILTRYLCKFKRLT
nr:MAG TPA: hypothetical protein [Caudoviricetes sp.]